MRAIQISESHVPVLDAIRGLAILLVLFIHVGESMPALPGIGWMVFHTLASSSWIGVDLFFVLSGFLITGILYDTREATNFFRTFYARRFLRIFPVYYGFLLLLGILTVPLRIDWRGREWVYLLYLQNTHVIKHVQSMALSPYFKIDHLWSLAVEEQFYCIWPAVVLLVKARGRLIKVTLILMIASTMVRLLMLYTGKSLWMIYIFTPARADSLMMGSLLALLFRSDAELQPKLKRCAAVLLPVCTVCLLVMAWPTQGLSFSSKSVICFGYTTIALASACLLTLSLKSRGCEIVINRPTLRWLGKYSYGIYVIHLPVMMIIQHLDWATKLGNMSSSPLWKMSVILGTVTFTLWLAFLSYNFYESRFLRLKRFFRYEFPNKSLQSRDVADDMLTCAPQSSANSL